MTCMVWPAAWLRQDRPINDDEQGPGQDKDEKKIVTEVSGERRAWSNCCALGYFRR
jgi:hypothetical protein